MLGVAMYTTIRTLWDLGKNKTEIARLTGHDWKTVAKVIKGMENGIDKPRYKDRDSIIEPFREEVIKLLDRGLSGIRIYQELKVLGFKGSYPTVKRYIRKMKKISEIFVRINTLPGEEAQVDFGYVGITKDDTGKNRKTWVFNMRLSYSRYDYYQKVYNQRVECLYKNLYEPVLVSYRFLYRQQVYPISIFLKSNFLEKTWHFNPILVYSRYIF